MATTSPLDGTVLELSVNNHPGVMAHICSLFSRRAFNVEGILCLPVGDRATSRVWMLVNEDARLEQVIKQLGKLQDVLEVRRQGGLVPAFLGLGEHLAPGDGRPAT